MPQPVLIPMGGMLIRFLHITQDEAEQAPTCENCGAKPAIQHELLKKDEEDWCIDCNDKHFRPNASSREDAEFCLDLTAKGYCVGVILEPKVGA